jgi:hypothetical protein
MLSFYLPCSSTNPICYSIHQCDRCHAEQKDECKYNEDITIRAYYLTWEILTMSKELKFAALDWVEAPTEE